MPWFSQELAVAIIVVLSLGNFHDVVAADPSRITIVSLGDSTTAPRNVGAIHSGRSKQFTTRGENADDAKNFPHNSVVRDDRRSPWLYVYSDILRDELPAHGFVLAAVDNEGIGGTRTDEALARLKADVQKKSPDWVIVQFGINDSWWDKGKPVNPATPDSSASRVALDSTAQTGGDGILGNGNDHPHADRGNYTDNLTQIVRLLRAGKTQVVLMTPNQLAYDGEEQWRNRLLAQYAKAARNVSDAERVPCTDVWKLCDDYVSNGRKSIRDLLIDSEHPNSIGHRMIAKALMDQIARRRDNSLLRGKSSSK